MSYIDEILGYAAELGDEFSAVVRGVWEFNLQLVSFPSWAMLHAQEVLGLSSSRQVLFRAMLLDVADKELVILASRYRSAIAELDKDRTNFVIEFESRKYLNGLEVAQLQDKLTTRQKRLLVSDSEYLAKKASIEADIEAAETKKLEAELMLDRAMLKLDTLQGEIELSVLEREEVEIQIKREELKVIEAELDVAMAVVTTAELQAAVLKLAAQLLMEDVKKFEYKADNAKTSVNIAEQELVGIDLEKLQAQYTVTLDKLQKLPPYELAMLGLKQDITADDLETEKSLYGLTEKANAARLDELASKLAARIDYLKATIDKLGDSVDAAQAEDAASTSVALLGYENSIEVAEYRKDTDEARIEAAKDATSAAIKAAETLANANIATNITHTIMAG